MMARDDVSQGNNRRMKIIAPLLFATPLALGACATKELPIEARIANATPAVTVTARGETTPVGTADADAADDPAIWRNPADPAKSLVLGTDKKAGLHVYDLSGKSLHFLDAGRVNNVDLRDDVIINGQRSVLAVASDRTDAANARLALFRLDTNSAQLSLLGHVAAGPDEAYGLCLGRDAAGVSAFLVLKDGTVRQILLDTSGATPTGRIVRTMKLSSQAEGCAVDDRTQTLYVAEEDVALWRFDARASGSTAPTKIADVDGKNLVADAEGVAVAPIGDKDGYIIVSSQGDNAYTLYRARDDSYVGRFRVGPGSIGGAEETDGIEVALGDMGPKYPGGLFVVQDGENSPHAQNFKFVAWDDVKKALGL